MSFSYDAVLAEPFPDLDPIVSLDDLPESFARLLVAVRRHLHKHPEVGFEEFETSRFLRETLEQYGLEVHGPVAETGLYTDVRGAHDGPHVGYRADIDALPIQEANQVSYASQHPGVAHLCGHDAHATVGVGVALLLHALRDRLHGAVRVFFQPNEEGTPSGAPLMIRDGVLDGLEAVYAIHADPTLAAGKYGLIRGAATASADRFRIRVRTDSTGHSARPHDTVDTIWVATQIATALYQLTGRVTDARNGAILTLCRFHGGEAYNVIPAEVELGGTLRCVSADGRATLRRYIVQIAQQTSALYGASADVDYDDGAPPVINDTTLVRHLGETVRALYGRSAVYAIPRPSMGAEDFAHYLKQVPGALVRVGTSSSPQTSFPLHDTKFDIDERVLAPTARLMAAVLMRHGERGVLRRG